MQMYLGLFEKEIHPWIEAPTCNIVTAIDAGAAFGEYTGEEEEILKGSERLNQRQGVRWLIETHSHDLEIACEARLRRANFKTAIIPNAWWRAVLPELRPCGHHRWRAAWNDDAVQRYG
jgi:hypothetical protein